MDDPNITMEEYIRLEEEKAQKRDVLDPRSVETEFPVIVFNDSLTSNETPSCEPTVSSLNDEIDFRISFDESDDEDYTVIYDENSFSYKIIYVNNLKADSENDNDKVNIPLFPSPEPTVNCINDLDFFKDFENEFPAIVYNDALTSKSDFSTEPTLCPQHIDKFDLKDETSLSEYYEVEQNSRKSMAKEPTSVITTGKKSSWFYNRLSSVYCYNSDIIETSKGCIPLKNRCLPLKQAIKNGVESSQKQNGHNGGTSSRTRSTEILAASVNPSPTLNNLIRYAWLRSRMDHGPYAVSGITVQILVSLKQSPSLRRLLNSLVDLGSSVTIMPFSTYTNLSLGDLSHTRMTIELANRTIKQPKGISANVLVRIGKFVFPIDFVILDIPEDNDVPLILG
ncbi:zinc finger, CCHC-type containing protein [Tanacetum coccineum]